jgi:hypothetical protein
MVRSPGGGSYQGTGQLWLGRRATLARSWPVTRECWRVSARSGETWWWGPRRDRVCARQRTSWLVVAGEGFEPSKAIPAVLQPRHRHFADLHRHADLDRLAHAFRTASRRYSRRPPDPPGPRHRETRRAWPPESRRPGPPRDSARQCVAQNEAAIYRGRRWVMSSLTRVQDVPSGVVPRLRSNRRDLPGRRRRRCSTGRRVRSTRARRRRRRWCSSRRCSPRAPTCVRRAGRTGVPAVRGGSPLWPGVGARGSGGPSGSTCS